VNVPGNLKAGIFHDAISTYTLVVVVTAPVRGVGLPQHVLEQARKDKVAVVTHWGDALPNPVGNMEADDVSLRGVLSFSGQPYATVIPWDAVLAILVEDAFAASFEVDAALMELPLTEPVQLPKAGFKPRVIDGGKSDG
jgi:stringent starvation protein B